MYKLTAMEPFGTAFGAMMCPFVWELSGSKKVCFGIERLRDTNGVSAYRFCTFSIMLVYLGKVFDQLQGFAKLKKLHERKSVTKICWLKVVHLNVWNSSTGNYICLEKF